jgi:uroporphyrinogen decarboxylase
VINSPLKIGGRPISGQDVTDLFGRPYMGGLDRKGVLSRGTTDQVRNAAQAALESAPSRFILGADCTVLAGTPWENLRTAIETARGKHCPGIYTPEYSAVLQQLSRDSQHAVTPTPS